MNIFTKTSCKNKILVECVSNAYQTIEKSPRKSDSRFFMFVESIVTEDNVDDLLMLTEAYCESKSIDGSALFEGFNEFARKHGGKVKAFMAGLMLLASVAGVANMSTSTDVTQSGSSTPIEMVSDNGNVDNTQDTVEPKPEPKAPESKKPVGQDGHGKGVSDGQKLIKLLASNNSSPEDLNKVFSALKGQAKIPGYMDGVGEVMTKAGLNMDKINDMVSGDSDKTGDAPEPKISFGSPSKAALEDLMKGIETNDESTRNSMVGDLMRSAGITEKDLDAKGYKIVTGESGDNYTAKLVKK